ncbi:stabilin-1-like isoform X2 [Mizuhopecten yessoensis]|uniref:stabilin-1-like isoform X2 n=1 Tax=Mizuhopecten yessoensis TaxID=6573 RepID=UPI000B45EA90|nr:stabilin-1-like isoform X2 [Mizuhopecten yessoensis]
MDTRSTHSFLGECLLSHKSLPPKNRELSSAVNTSLDPNVTTSQSSEYDDAHTSGEVVDGCTNQRHNSGCCSHTQGDPALYEAWWQIDLGDQVVIEYVKIYYRGDGSHQTARFAGYQVYLSNTTGWRNSDICHNDTTSTQSMVDLTPRITSCTGNTRYLTIYVDRQTLAYSWYSAKAILELCEVQVYGCPVGKYGNSNCGSNCDATCVNSLCHPNSGQCTYCAAGFYKAEVRCIPCSQNCLNDVCDVETSTCSACISGYYGSQCDQSCPDNCPDKICDQYSGVCTECVPGVFGPNCTQTCPVSCQDKCERNTVFDLHTCSSEYIEPGFDHNDY